MPSQVGMARESRDREVFSSPEFETAAEKRPTAPDVAESTRAESVRDLNVNRGTVRQESMISLVNEQGERVGQATVGDPVISQQLIDIPDIQIRNREEEMAAVAAHRIDEPGADRQIEQVIEKHHLEAVMILLFRLYHERFGGQVYEAKSVTFDEGWTDLQDTEGRHSKRTEYEYVIPRSGAEQMKSLLTGEALPQYLLDAGMQFDVDPAFGQAFGDRGFSVTLNVGIFEGQPKKSIDINFLYGDDTPGIEEPTTKAGGNVVSLDSRRAQEQEIQDLAA